MKKLFWGCAVAATVAFSPASESRLPARLPAGFLAWRTQEQAVGIASWYGAEVTSCCTANGEVFDNKGLTAAHRDLPFGTTVRVTNLANNRSVTLRINDRGPSIQGRVIDVSKAAAKDLGFIEAGLTKVRIKVVSRH